MLNSIRIPLERQLIVLPIETVNLSRPIWTPIWNPLAPSLPFPALSSRSRNALSTLAYKVHNYSVDFPSYRPPTSPLHRPLSFPLCFDISFDTWYPPSPNSAKRQTFPHRLRCNATCDIQIGTLSLICSTWQAQWIAPVRDSFIIIISKWNQQYSFHLHRLIFDAATRKHFRNFQLFSIN